MGRDSERRKSSFHSTFGDGRWYHDFQPPCHNLSHNLPSSSSHDLSHNLPSSSSDLSLSSREMVQSYLNEVYGQAMRQII